MLHRLILVLMSALLTSACGDKTDYPNWPTKVVQYGDGLYGLENWKPQIGQCRGQRNCIVPNHAAYQGSVAWAVQSDERNPKKAATSTAKAQGMTSISVMATARADRKIVKALEPDKKGRVTAVMLKGKIDGDDARAVMLVWYGRFGHADGAPSTSGVHAFMAPTKAFEALGGNSIPAVLWFGATTTSDEDMRDEGELGAKKATQRLTHFYESWAGNYATNQALMQSQTLAIQAQTLQNMMSYNMALGQCDGFSCDLTMAPDGSWTAE